MNRLRKRLSGGISLLLLISGINAGLFSGNIITVQAAAKDPQVAASGAVLYNANTGEFLYEKNGDVQFYPASITKVMTALLTLENADLDETVTFSKTATTNMESGAVSLGVVAGDKISVRDSLYGLMLKSANEVANGLAEHVGGSIPGFAAMMNARAKELGAKNTNFVNPSGLNNPKHVTTARDMALIAAEAFKNPNFRDLVGTAGYTFPSTIARSTPTAITMGHKMIYVNDNRYYQGIIGGKTGYTRSAGNTLVTGAQRNGVRLVVVILKSASTHYSDTKALLDYGFEIASAGGGIAKDTAVSKRIKDAPVSFAAKEEGNAVQTVMETRADSAKIEPGTGSGIISTTLGNIEAVNNSIEYGPGAFMNKGWQQSGGKWKYVKDNNSFAKDEILDIEGHRYWFDSDEYMATGWRQDSGGAWYFMSDHGGMDISTWVLYKELWYYLGSDGKMLTNATTPDGYYVNSDGVWVYR